MAPVLAAASSDDDVLEPSPGNRLLVAQLGRVAALQLNEIDPARRARLLAIFPDAPVFAHDGAAVASIVASLPRPSLIIMNPPFSRSIGRGVDALAAAPPAGRDQARPAERTRGGDHADWFSNSAQMGEIWAATFD